MNSPPAPRNFETGLSISELHSLGNYEPVDPRARESPAMQLRELSNSVKSTGRPGVDEAGSTRKLNGELKEGSFVKGKLNPKDLSNEELEYIIRTGKMPSAFGNKENSAQDANRPPPISQSNPSMKRTNPHHN